MTRISAIWLVLAFVLAAVPSIAAPRAVIELFTSQGCSSCPPADRIVDEMAGRSDVLPLSYHVEYWDYLGWADTLGIEAAAERQAAYAAVEDNRRLFTPEMVINGVDHVVGSDAAKVEGAVASASLPLPVSLAYEDEELHIEVSTTPDATIGKATVRLVTFRSKAEVEIQRGENRGATITYRNVVRSIQPIGVFDGEPVSITLPADEMMGEGADGCAVIVQEDGLRGPGRIVGAASVKHETM